MDIKDLRKQIDEKDDKLSEVFTERMLLCKEIGKVKARENAAINASERENEIIARVAKDKPEELVKYVALLYRNIFSLSKAYQSEFYAENSGIGNKITGYMKNTDKISASVAVFGGEKARYAARRSFPVTVITDFKNSDGAIKAVRSGLCDFVVLPAGEGDGFGADVIETIAENGLFIVKTIETECENGGSDAESCGKSFGKSCGKSKFVVLSSDGAVFKGADRVSVALELDNRPGSLLMPVSRISGAAYNVTEIKSIAKNVFKTLVFIEFECDVMTKEALNLMSELKISSGNFYFLGAYKQTV